MAASLKASAKVGCAWQVLAMSSLEAPYSRGQRGLGDHLAGVGSHDVHAQQAVRLGSASTLTMPSVSALVLAREGAEGEGSRSCT